MASSATFTVTAVASGTTSITASLNGASAQSPTLNVAAIVALSSISLSAQSVIGGSSLVGGVALTGEAETRLLNQSCRTTANSARAVVRAAVPACAPLHSGGGAHRP